MERKGRINLGMSGEKNMLILSVIKVVDFQWILLSF